MKNLLLILLLITLQLTTIAQSNLGKIEFIGETKTSVALKTSEILSKEPYKLSITVDMDVDSLYIFENYIYEAFFISDVNVVEKEDFNIYLFYTLNKDNTFSVYKFVYYENEEDLLYFRDYKNTIEYYTSERKLQ